MENPINYWYQKYISLKDEMDKMMSKAVEAFVLPLDKEIWCNELDKFPELKEGEKVKLIIIKENEK